MLAGHLGSPVRDYTVVLPAFRRIGQDFIGLPNLMKSRRGVSIFGDVRMVLPGEVAVRGSDAALIQARIDAKDSVVINKRYRHDSTSYLFLPLISLDPGSL